MAASTELALLERWLGLPGRQFGARGERGVSGAPGSGRSERAVGPGTGLRGDAPTWAVGAPGPGFQLAGGGSRPGF